MTTQSELDFSAVRARARNTDPAPSHVAAREVERIGAADKQRLVALEAVYRSPGATAAELGARMAIHSKGENFGLDSERNYRMLGRRLPELRQSGVVQNGIQRICAIRNRLALTWWPRKIV